VGSTNRKFPESWISRDAAEGPLIRKAAGVRTTIQAPKTLREEGSKKSNISRDFSSERRKALTGRARLLQARNLEATVGEIST